MSNPNKLRHKARCLALQALYQAQFSESDVDLLIQHAIEGFDLTKFDFVYLQDLVKGVVHHRSKIDETIRPILDRNFEDLNPIELAVLRLAVYELLYRLDVPYKVVINEALEIQKKYGSAEGHKYINGILDALAPTLRASEKLS